MDNDRAKRLKALREAKQRKEAGGAPAEEVVAVPVKHIPAEEAPVVEAVAPEAAPEEEEVVAIAPKKPTWDLERSLEKQMKKLERRTQNAIVQILREKMAAEEEEDA
ncbi:hypothetical protein ACHHYP_05172 [Achlya hypogyna]|uniref:Coiled-coil domain-containing protein 12 n=1 Tax=Achlya hypogyna TaxID=1202772 RepID=A0A1V9YYT5_ACHHY|nr:hypothetical protein ACHHYP_05172 [Achlya hypogyna]